MTAAPMTPLVAVAYLAIAIASAVCAYRRAWLGPAAVALTAPFAWYHQFGPTELSVSKAATIGALAGAALALRSDRARLLHAALALRQPAVWLIAAFALYSTISATWAISSADALRDALKWWWYACVVLLTAASIVERRDLVKVAVAIFATSAVVGAFGFAQSVFTAPTVFVASDGSIIGRAVATLEGPNQFGAYLESVIPLLFAGLLLARSKVVPAVAGAVLLGLLGADLLLTYSRGALWSCVAALVFVGVAYAVQRRSPSTTARTASPAVAAAVCAISAAVVVGIAHTSIPITGWQHELWSEAFRDKTESVEYRKALWSCAGEVFSHHLVTGVGAGNFAHATSACDEFAAGRNADHWYLETAADLGVIGLALLAGFLVVMLAAARSPPMWSDFTGIGAYAVLVAFVLHGFVDDVMFYPKAVLTFFVVMGMLLRASDTSIP